MLSHNKVVAIIGGTGSFGHAMTRFLLENTSMTIRIFSRDENKQYLMKKEFREYSNRIRFFIGDVRDLTRLTMALSGVAFVFHAAALKYVDTGEYDPEEFVKTNILGSQNVIHACMACHVDRAVFLSSDKAVRSISLYGATKAVSEKLWTRANGYSPHGTEFVVLRYGNVSGSRGSVLPLWKNCIAMGISLPITDLSMSRFYISLYEAVTLAWFSAMYAQRGAIVIPHIPAYTVGDMVEALCKESKVCDVSLEHIGIRPGEKYHEQLIDEGEAKRLACYTVDNSLQYYVIKPMMPSWEIRPIEEWECPDAVRIREPRPWREHILEDTYCSEVWPYRLSVEDLRQRLREDG